MPKKVVEKAPKKVAVKGLELEIVKDHLKCR